MNASQQEFKVCFAKNTLHCHLHFGYKLGEENKEIFGYVFENFFLATVQNQSSTGCTLTPVLMSRRRAPFQHLSAHSTLPENQDKDGNRDRKTDVLCFNNSKKCFMQPDQQSPVGCFYSVDLSRRLSEKISCRNITYQCTLAALLPRRIILGQTNKRRASH